MDNLERIITADGSHTLRNNQLGETYHSVHGAMQESLYVFLENGLTFYHRLSQLNKISVLEIGFGTGLNALLVMQYARKNNVHIRYTTLEPNPLSEEVWSTLNYPNDDRDFTRVHAAKWGELVELAPEFAILKKSTTLQQSNLTEPVNVIFFDAFAPSVQPELWELESLKKVTDTLVTPGLFVTYSAKGQLKRDLRTLGLMVETLPGPPGKLQMVRASKL